MSDEKTPGKWDLVNDQLQQNQPGRNLPMPSGHPLGFPASSSNVPSSGIPVPETASDTVSGLMATLANYKMGKLTRKAALDKATVWHAKELEVVKHQLTEAVRVRKAEATTVADQLLANINSKHLQFLVDLGLGEQEKRKAALKKLTDQTSAALAEALHADWPDVLRTQYLEGVYKLHGDFFAKLTTELGA